MTDPLPARRYGEKDIGRILKRATELQHAEPSMPAGAGMTLAELEEIAAEAGIDPRYLRRAASEIETGVADDSIWVRVVGDEMMLVRETRIPGELAEDGFERIVAVIQRNTREHGQPSLLGRSLTWRAETPSKTRTIQVTVTSSRGYTDVRIEESLHQFAGGLFGGVVAGVGGGVGLGVGLPIGLEVLGSALFAVAAPLGVTALAWLGSREIYRAVVRKRRRLLSELFGQVVAEVDASIRETTISPPEGPQALPAG